MIEVGIVPHTHWDREWYAPFQVYRVQLVHLVDELLDLMERDPSYTRFLLDGQIVVVDDYLEVRPEAHHRIRALVADRRLQVGPWAVLMDEFMVSGETMVRNLQRGLARTAALGSPPGMTHVSYLPDMFGHIAQMPQLLQLAGLEHAVVWRGVPSAINRTAFDWYAPDGSRVRAEYLYGSYSNGRDLPNDPAQLVARAHGYEAELGGARLPDGGMLLMNGADHLPPQPWLGRLVAAANNAQDEYHFTITSLGEWVEEQPTNSLPAWHGELRSGARANVLMGVASNRIDVHQVAAAAERAVERVAEPLCALLLPPGKYPHRLLDVAWDKLVLNSAHDSSCACSSDDVVEAVRVRYQEARHVGDALARDARRQLATEVDAPPGSTIVVNPAQAARGGLVEITVAGTAPAHVTTLAGTPCPSQVIDTLSGEEGLSTIVVGRKIRWVLEMMRGPELAGARIARVDEKTLTDGTVEFTFHDAAPGDELLDLEATRTRLLALGDAGATISIRQRRAPLQRIAFVADAVPGFGWRTYRVVDGPGPTGAGTGAHAEHTRLRNEHVLVAVDPLDGTLSIAADGIRVTGANRYVDGGDGGDTYNYSPPASDTIVDRPEGVSVSVGATGPARARLVITARYLLPTHAIGDARSCSRRSDATVVTDVVTTLELRAGERFLRVHTELDHRACDHRLRAHFPLPRAVGGSDAECAFAVVHRGLHAEGGPHEFGLPTFVSRRFVDCSADGTGLAVLHDGLLEYEVVDHGRELALTLLRATGYLSRSELSLRPNPAGPLDRLEGPQLQRRLAFDYALLPHRGSWRDACLYEAADEFLVALPRVRGGGWPGASRPPEGSTLRVDGAQVSAVVRDPDGTLVVRVYNPSDEPAAAEIAVAGAPATGEVIDLTRAPRARFEGRVDLRPWEIATLRIADTR